MPELHRSLKPQSTTGTSFLVQKVKNPTRVTFSDTVTFIPNDLTKIPSTVELLDLKEDQADTEIDELLNDLEGEIRTANLKAAESTRDYKNHMREMARKNRRTDTIKLCKLPYRTGRKKRPMLIIKGKINDQNLNILVNSGCEESILSTDSAKRLKSELEPSTFQAERWDGSLAPLQKVKSALTLHLDGQIKHNITPFVSEDIGYDLILGMDWLQTYNPHINWAKNKIKFYNKPTKTVCTLGVTDISKSTPRFLVTAKQMARSARKLPVYLLSVKEAEEYLPEKRKPRESEQTSEADLDTLLSNYSDVFPDQLPEGLPPKRSVELNIELKPGSEPVKRPIYKLSTEELAEVKSQVDELL